jgi:MFS family permease
MLSSLKTAFHKVRNYVPLEKRNKFMVYALILIGTALDNLNSMSALTMSPDIKEAFGTDTSTASWVLSGYGLTLGSFIMVTGKISDVIGPHNLYIIGITIIWICALICACIPHTSIIPLIVFRAIQGIGASSLLPSTMSITANYFSGDDIKYLGPAIICMIVALTATLGVGIVLGGAFSLTSIGYQSFFYFIFAYALVVDIALLFFIIPINKTAEHAKMKLKNINFVSSFLMIVGCLLVILGLTEGGEKWKSAKAIAPLVVGFFTIISSFLYENYYLKPYQIKHQNMDKSSDWRLQVDILFPGEILKIPNFPALLITSGAYYAILTMMVSVVVQYHTFIDHDSTIIVALKAFPSAVGLVFGAFVFRDSYYQKIGHRKMFILSGAISLGSVIWLSRMSFEHKNSYWKYEMVSMFLFGYGCNMFFNMYMPTAISHTPLHLQGVVMGVFQTGSQLMLSVGNALIPSIVGNINPAITFDQKKALHTKFETVLYVIIAIQAVVFLIMIFMIRIPSETTAENPTEAMTEKVDSNNSADNTNNNLSIDIERQPVNMGSDNSTEGTCSVEKESESVDGQKEII